MAAHIAMAWFPVSEFNRALELWPGFIDRWPVRDHPDYCRHVDDELRAMTAAGIAPIDIAPILLAEYLPWCDNQGVDPAEPEARSAYVAHLSHAGQTISWPPQRTSSCWCGSGDKYKHCCGHHRPLHQLHDQSDR